MSDSRLPPISESGWESKIVRPGPFGVHWEIQAAQMFGWNLLSKQDISYPVDVESYSEYGYTDSVVHTERLTDLHLVRPLDLPNLKLLKDLEAEYPFEEPLLPKEPWWFFKKENEKIWKNIETVYENCFQIIAKLRQIDQNRYDLMTASFEKLLQTRLTNLRHRYGKGKS